ncbi:MAG: GcrA family cell cycle regulator [Rickettsiales bacterium]|jgi:GcrA cell cycle regulator|nr:GcrA family cell cycle regulator [Rickettsiales bacterium]
METAGWTAKEISRMKALYEKGLSMSEIGAKLGKSKNQIVGKINRLGLNGPNATAVKKTPAKAAAPKKAPAKVAPKKVEPAKKAGVSNGKGKVGAVKNGKSVSKTPAKPATKAPVKGAAKVAPKAAPKPKAEPAPKPTPKRVAGKVQERNVNHALALAELGQDQCRWPIGNTNSDDFHFCGKKVFVGKPYCFEHCKASYIMTPASPRK